MNNIKSFLSYSYGGIIGLFVGLATTSLLTRYLSPEEFGKGNLFLIFLNFSTILVVFGADQFLIRFFYSQEFRMRNLLYECLFIVMIFFVLYSLLIISFNETISLFLFGKVESSWILLAGVISYVLLRFSQTVIRMNQRANLFSITTIISRFLYLLFIVIMIVIFGNDYRVMIYGIVLSTFITSSLSIIFQLSSWKPKNYSFKDSINRSKIILSYSTPLFIAVLLNLGIESSSQLTLNYFKLDYEIGIYSAAFKIISLVSIFQISFVNFWIPLAIKKYTENPEDLRFYNISFRVVSFVMTFIIIVIISLRDILIIILGENYYDTKYIIPLMLFIPLMFTLSETTSIGINLKKKSSYYMYSALITLTVSLLLNFSLIPLFGLYGAAFSCAITYFVLFILRTLLAQRVFPMKFDFFTVAKSTTLVFLYAVIGLRMEETLQYLLIGIVILFFHIIFNKHLIYELVNTYRKRRGI